MAEMANREATASYSASPSRCTHLNLAEILDNLSKVIRERFKLYRHIKVSTAEGRLSLYFLMGLPVVTGFFMYLTNPDYMTPLIEEPLGHLFLEVAVALQIVGYFIIRKITSMKV